MATKKLAVLGQSVGLHDDASTAAPSDALRDDASEFTDASGWCHLEGVDEGSEATTTASTDGGRLVEGPDGKPMRVFRTSAELRAARLRQMGRPVPKAKAKGVSQVQAAKAKDVTRAEGGGGCNAGLTKSSVKSRPATAEAAPKSSEALPAPPRREDERQEAKETLKAKLAAQAASSKATSRCAKSPDVGAHRALGAQGAVHSLPSGYISSSDGPVGATKKGDAQTWDEAKLRLDKISKEQLRDAGLYERMPVRNPVVVESDSKRGGYNWHVPFPAQEYVHTLGGVPDAKPVARPHEADEAFRQMDKVSREELQTMGLWEHMPVRNPIIVESDSKRGGYNWHVPFPAQEFQHTLGGVPDPKPLPRPHKADEAKRQLDVMTRENLRDAGMWERCPGRNPVATESASKRGGVNWTVSPR